MAKKSEPEDQKTKWEDNRLSALVNAAEHAIQRACYVLIVICVAATLMVTAQFNGMVPFLRHDHRKELKSKEPDNKVSLQIHTAILEQDLGILTIPILGIKIHSADLSIIGSVTMAVLVFWFYGSSRNLVGDFRLSTRKFLGKLQRKW